MLLRFFVLLVPLVVATDRVFELERMMMTQAPCVRGFVEGFPSTSSQPNEPVNETIPDRCFEIETHRSDVFLRLTSRPGYMRDIHIFGTEGTRVIIDRSGAEPPTEWRQFNDRLGVSLNSDFGRAVGSMFLLPPRGPTYPYRMIIRAQDPSAFCVDRQLIMVNVFEGNEEYHDLVEVGISFIHESAVTGDNRAINESTNSVQFVNNSTYGFGIESSEVMTVLPVSVWEELVRIARDVGMNVVSDYELGIGCADRIRLLPTIRFQINFAVNIYLSPTEYLRFDEGTGRCEWQILGFDEGYRFGSNMLDRVGLYYDYAEHRIGFCDPLYND